MTYANNTTDTCPMPDIEDLNHLTMLSSPQGYLRRFSSSIDHPMSPKNHIIMSTNHVVLARASSKEHRNLYSMVTVIFACLGSITYGYCSCIVSTTLASPGFLVDMRLDTAPNASDLFGAIQALFQVGALIGGLMSGFTSDPLGRRTAIFLACCLVVVGSALQTGSIHVAMFIVARFITGLGIGNLVIIVPTWQSEVSNPHSRGLLVGMHGTFILVGYSLALWIGTGFSFIKNGDVQWRTPIAFQIIPPLLLACGIYLIPESPRWLLQHGREQEALDVCKKLRSNPQDPDNEFAISEFAGIKAQYEHDRTLDASWSAIFRVKSYRRRALIGFSALFLAQCTGTQVINNYGPTIYKMIGFGPSAQLFLSCGWITSGILSNFISALIMDKVGRVNMMRFGFIGTLISLIGATITLAIGTRTGNQSVLRAAVWFIYMHIATYGAGLDCPTYVYGVELWPNHLRGKGAAISVSGLFVGALIVLTAASTAFAKIEWKYYIVFVVLTAIGSIVSLFCFPEFNGLSLEQAGALFGDHVEVPVPEMMDEAGFADKELDDTSNKEVA